MTLRGIFYGALVSVGCMSIIPLFVGAFMPLFYYIGLRLLGHKLRWVSDGVQAAEIIFGGAIVLASCVQYLF